MASFLTSLLPPLPSALAALQVPHHHSLGARAEPQRAGCLPNIYDSCALYRRTVFPVETRIATKTQHAIDPRTGEELRFGPAMAEKAIGVDLPALRKLFADIKSWDSCERHAAQHLANIIE